MQGVALRLNTQIRICALKERDKSLFVFSLILCYTTLMKRFEISKNDADQRLDKFITKSVPALPVNLMYKYIRLKRIKINGKRAQISTRLHCGDVVEMYINDEFFETAAPDYEFLKAGKQLDIVYEDENLLILEKRVGLLCHPDKSEYTDTLIGRVLRYLYEKGDYQPDKENSFTPSLANRIDRNTGGLVLCAKNAAALRVLNQKIKDREIRKQYLCIACGNFDVKEKTLTAYLFKDEAKNKVIVKNKPFPGAKTIVTKYTVLEQKPRFALLEIDLLTGRTHQIRAHLAHIGHPLLGDGKYSDNKEGKKIGYKKQALYSYKLRFDFSTDADCLAYLNGKEFTARHVPLYEDFAALR